jgi:D-lyxose ketol-isomerase
MANFLFRSLTGLPNLLSHVSHSKTDERQRNKESKFTRLTLSWCLVLSRPAELRQQRGHLKRSEINLFIAQAMSFFEAHSFSLPPFAHWTPEMWNQLGKEASQIRARQLGWDVTDFHSGDFFSQGLTLFTLRNGLPGRGDAGYAEKIMMVRDQQVTPLHRHHRKTEDIINRGNASTGDLVIQLYQADGEGGLADTPVRVFCDGVIRHTEPGGSITVRAGESITLSPGIYHAFHAVHGNALIGEVSSTNNDAEDNHFYHPLGRFPQIVEDEPPLRLLCTEYPGHTELTSPLKGTENIE